MRTNVSSRVLCIAALLAPLVGCPSTDPTPPSIDEVVVQTTVAVPSFELLVKGHGFGLRDVSFDLSAGTGKASLDRPRIVLRTAMGTIPDQVRAITTTVTSPSEAYATVYLRAPLPAGEYGVELYVGESSEPLADRDPAFVVGSALIPTADDAGLVTPAPDATPLPGLDAQPGPELAPGEDARPAPDADPFPLDGGDPGDGGVLFLDAAASPDGGLGPFPSAHGFRRPITLANDTGLTSPVDITVRIPVPHAQMLAAGQSRADGLDLVVYQGAAPLPHQVEDAALLGTDRLELIVRLNVLIPAGSSAGIPLALLSDPLISAATPSDAVYVFAERFDAPLVSDPDDPNRFNDRWEQSCIDRVTSAASGSKCRQDAENGLTRRSIATPRALGMPTIRTTNEVYEIVGYVGGAMQSANDILYFSYGPDNSSFHQTTLLPEGAYDAAFRPNATLTFQETDGRNRTVSGWRLPAVAGPYARMKLRLVPAIPTPNLHFRYISADNQTNQNTQVRLDDLTVRRALNPDFTVTVGPVETR